MNMNNDKYSIQRLVSDLECLLRMSVEAESPLDGWYIFANEIEENIYDYNLHEKIPEFVIHYLADADIRFKDKVYSSSQDTEMKRILSDLKGM